MLHFSGELQPPPPPRQREQPAAALAPLKSMHPAALAFYRGMRYCIIFISPSFLQLVWRVGSGCKERLSACVLKVCSKHSSIKPDKEGTSKSVEYLWSKEARFNLHNVVLQAPHLHFWYNGHKPAILSSSRVRGWKTDSETKDFLYSLWIERIGKSVFYFTKNQMWCKG